jgi:hypothetical protein
MIEKFSPDDFAMLEFSDKRDYEVCTKIYDGFKPFIESGHRFRAELHLKSECEK